MKVHQRLALALLISVSLMNSIPAQSVSAISPEQKLITAAYEKLVLYNTAAKLLEQTTRNQESLDQSADLAFQLSIFQGL